MYDLKSDTDAPLTSFINDYAEGKLNAAEISAFHEFVSYDEELSAFAENARKGRNALRNAFSVQAADDFEDKLQRRIRTEVAVDNSLDHVARRYLFLSLPIMLRQCDEYKICTSV